MNLQIHPKFWSGGILGHLIFQSRQSFKKLFHKQISRNDPERNFIDPRKIFWSSGKISLTLHHIRFQTGSFPVTIQPLRYYIYQRRTHPSTAFVRQFSQVSAYRDVPAVVASSCCATRSSWRSCLWSFVWCSPVLVLRGGWIHGPQNDGGPNSGL